MAERTPLVVVLAGPNGAGKSTSAARLLQGALAVDEFVNADTIAQGLSAYRPESAAVAAGRIMLARLQQLARLRRDFAFETTLSGRVYAGWLKELRGSGYRVHLIFLALSHPNLAIARVAERVRNGGHHVPDEVVRRRYLGGLRNLFGLYSGIAESWQVYDNSLLDGPRLVASRRAGAAVEIADATAWDALKKEQ